MFCIRLLIPDNTVEDMNNVMLLRHGLTNITKLTSGVGGEGTFDSMPTPWDPARPQPTNLVHPPLRAIGTAHPGLMEQAPQVATNKPGGGGAPGSWPGIGWTLRCGHAFICPTQKPWNSVHPRGYIWTGWVWEITDWNSRLQGKLPIILEEFIEYTPT